MELTPLFGRVFFFVSRNSGTSLSIKAMIPSPATIPQKEFDKLQAYHWPGNVRELENVIERAMITSPGRQLELGDWLPKTRASSAGSSVSTLEELEREHILKVLDQTGWRVSGEKGAAKILEIKPTTLQARMKKLGIKCKR